ASPATRLYPAVGLMGRGARLTTNFGQRPFSYAFESYINRERVFKENNLIDRVCKEEFAGPKMRECVHFDVLRVRLFLPAIICFPSCSQSIDAFPFFVCFPCP
ncbi:hypothetical protein CRM22_011274, partial [Opisthorchis felineus]